MRDFDTAASLLAWHREMGADEVVGAAPADWFAAARGPEGGAASARAPRAAPPPAATPASARVATAAAPIVGDAAAEDARARAAAAGSLDDLLAALKTFEGCALKTTAKNLCFARGSAAARLMLIGEAPGRDEDLQGLPFVGRAGQLLDRMLAAIGLGEQDVYITNIVYWRPPGNRTPSVSEVEACRPFLLRQIELLDPAIVILIGAPAAQHLLGTSEGIMRLRGRWREAELGGRVRRVMPILHPAYLLRTPAAKRLAWRDLLEIEAALKEVAR